MIMLPSLFALATIVLTLISFVASSSSATSITLLFNFNNSQSSSGSSGVSGYNISYGDPHKWLDHASTINNEIYHMSQVFSNTTGTYVLTFWNPTSASDNFQVSTSIIKLTDSVFPSLSGWIASSPASSQDSSVCPEPVCLYIGTMKGVAAVAPRSGKILWNTDLFAENQVVPGHVTYSSWNKNVEGIVWVTFESGVNSSQVFMLSPRDGRAVPVIPEGDGVNEVAYTLLWAIESSTSDLDPVFSSAIVYGAYHTKTKKVGMVCRAVVGSSSSSQQRIATFPPVVVELWANWSLSYTPPGLWDNPNIAGDLPLTARLRNFKQRIFAYYEKTLTHRIVHRLNTMTGAVMWHRDIFSDVPDYDTYSYLGNFFRLMLRQNSTLQLEKLDGATGDRVWEYQQQNFTDTNAILLVGSGLVASFGLNSGLIYLVNEKNGQYIGEIDISKDVHPVGGLYLCTGVTISLTNNNNGMQDSILMFGAADGQVRSYLIRM